MSIYFTDLIVSRIKKYGFCLLAPFIEHSFLLTMQREMIEMFKDIPEDDEVYCYGKLAYSTPDIQTWNFDEIPSVKDFFYNSEWIPYVVSLYHEKTHHAQ